MIPAELQDRIRASFDAGFAEGRSHPGCAGDALAGEKGTAFRAGPVQLLEKDIQAGLVDGYLFAARSMGEEIGKGTRWERTENGARKVSCSMQLVSGPVLRFQGNSFWADVEVKAVA